MTAKKRGPRANAIPKIGCVQHDCATCKAQAKLLGNVIRCLQNAEPFMRGFPAGPLTLAHQNIVEALGFLNVRVEESNLTKTLRRALKREVMPLTVNRADK